MLPPNGDPPRPPLSQSGMSGTDLREPASDLVGDIRRKEHRRQVRRRLLIAAGLLALLAAGVAAWQLFQAQARSARLADAAAEFERGNVVNLRRAAERLAHDRSETVAVAEARALLAVQLWAEFGFDEDAAREHVDRLDRDTVDYDGAVAIALWHTVAGEFQSAEDAMTRAVEQGGGTLAPGHHAYVAALLAIAQRDREALATARTELQQQLAQTPRAVALRRVSIAAAVAQKERGAALAELDAAREQHRDHMGLAADEALYNATFRQHVGGVASVAEQLLAAGDDVPPRDRAHAELALAAAQAYSGDFDQSLTRLKRVWPALPACDRLGRDLALELAILDGDGDLAREWIEASRVPPIEADLLGAAILISRGEIMESLEALAQLPQEHPRVAYLQGLALVEQGRVAEAEPWLRRADQLVPGRLDVEVALARVELHLNDADAALRKLEGLSEEEALAPRVWTGLGEAYRVVAQRRGDDKDLLRAAQRALERALERERAPAEAMLQLAMLHDSNRQRTPESPGKALDLFARAAETNPHLPRYAERYGRYLASLGHRHRALAQLAPLVERRGIEPATVLAAIRLAIELDEHPDRPSSEALDHWFERAEELRADPTALARERARRQLADGSRAALTAALEAMNQVIASHPIDSEARVLASRAALRLYERKEAETILRRGLANTPEPDRGLLYLQWASIEARTGARGKGAAHARVAWRLLQDSDGPAADALDAARLAVRLFIELDKPIPAFAVGRDISRAMPYHADAWVLRARGELAAKKSAEALEHAGQAVTVDPTNPFAHEMLGHCHMRFGHKDEARAAYTKAVEHARTPGQKKGFRDNLRRL
ncbi:MAG: tetratricopeptide repeat protein [Myxococcales bacterium FL481]|nr:MAG: tetratricopeptide repeat protein [Myxococcales bacterium FL481]